MPIALGALLATLWITVAAFGRRSPTAGRSGPQPPLRKWPWFRRRPRYVVVDGSNVMHWQDNVPQLTTVTAVLRRLEAEGFTPQVIFDATAGYRLTGRYQSDHALAQMCGLPVNRVIVVNKGTSADPLILRAARLQKAPIVSNDRYRDWAADWPEVSQSEHFIRGRWTASGLELWGGPLQTTLQ